MSKKEKTAYVKTSVWPVLHFVAIGGRPIEYKRARKIVKFLKKRGRYAFVAEAA